MTINRRILVATTALALGLAACSSADDGATVTNLGEEGGSVSGSASGSGSGSASGSASAPASGSASGTSEMTDTTGTSDGAYEYASDVSSHRLVVLDVCEIKDLLDADPIDYAAVEAAYREGGNSPSGDGFRTLADFATADDRLHGLDDYFDTDAPLDAFVSSALDGGENADEADAVRSQILEKGTQNAVMVAWTVHELNTALAKAEDGDLDAATGAPHNWDEAWAFYHGAAPDCAPYATAESRAGNFGTVEGDVARANANIATAMNEGRDALLDGDVEGARAAADEVVRNVVATYSQAAIRYATTAAAAAAEGDGAEARIQQAEGLAFFRVIAPYVAEAGADVDTISAIMSLDNDPAVEGDGDDVREALRPAWDALGIDEPTDIGTLQ